MREPAYLLFGEKSVEEGFRGGSVVKSGGSMQETQLLPLGREEPPEEEMTSHSSILAGKPHGQRSLVAVHGGCKIVGHNFVTKPPPQQLKILEKSIIGIRKETRINCRP